MTSLIPIPRKCNRTFANLTDHIDDLFENDDSTLLSVFRLFGTPHLINPANVTAVISYDRSNGDRYTTIYTVGSASVDTQLHPDVIQRLLTDYAAPVTLQRHISSHAVGGRDHQISTIRAMFHPSVELREYDLHN